MYSQSELVEKINKVIENGPFCDTWDSLKKYEPPKWYRDAKFGIFIHWGIFSVPAFGNEWYSRHMYMQGTPEFEHHVKAYGPQKEFGYKDFIPMFTAQKFDADEWAKLFKEAGAQYVTPVAEHHDGFQMYDSDLSDWCASKKGPCRDVLGELYASFDKYGLKHCASSHRVEHWFFMGHGKEFDSDIHEPLRRGDFYWPAMPEADHFDFNSEPTPTEEFLTDWLCRCCELVDKYQPRLIYFDWWISHKSVEPYLRKFAAYYYNRAAEWGEGVVINYKHEAFPEGCAVVDIEKGQFAQAKPYVWQTDTTVAWNSWCYTEGNVYKSSVQIIRDLVDIVSKNGRLMLNVGPRADGTIPDGDRKILLEIGEWLETNGRAIYGAEMWNVSAEGPTQIKEGKFTDGEKRDYTSEDIRFTVAGGKLFAICLNMTGVSEICIKSLSAAGGLEITGVSRLDNVSVKKFEQDDRGLHIYTDMVKDERPIVFEIN